MRYTQLFGVAHNDVFSRLPRKANVGHSQQTLPSLCHNVSGGAGGMQYFVLGGGSLQSLVVSLCSNRPTRMIWAVSLICEPRGLNAM
jgi:hypothetical protein